MIDLSREIQVPRLKLPRAKSTCTSNYNSVSTAITLPSTTNSRFGDSKVFKRHATICCEWLINYYM